MSLSGSWLVIVEHTTVVTWLSFECVLVWEEASKKHVSSDFEKCVEPPLPIYLLQSSYPLMQRTAQHTSTELMCYSIKQNAHGKKKTKKQTFNHYFANKSSSFLLLNLSNSHFNIIVSILKIDNRHISEITVVTHWPLSVSCALRESWLKNNFVPNHKRVFVLNCFRVWHQQFFTCFTEHFMCANFEYQISCFQICKAWKEIMYDITVKLGIFKIQHLWIWRYKL